MNDNKSRARKSKKLNPAEISTIIPLPYGEPDACGNKPGHNPFELSQKANHRSESVYTRFLNRSAANALKPGGKSNRIAKR